MEKDKLVEIVTDVKNKSNKDLFLAVNELYEEFEKTKKITHTLTLVFNMIKKQMNFLRMWFIQQKCYLICRQIQQHVSFKRNMI